MLNLVAEGYPALIPVGAKLHLHLIAYHYFYVIQTHLAGQVGQDHFTVFQLDPELGVRKGFYNRPDNFYFLLVVQNELMPSNKVVCYYLKAEGPPLRNHGTRLYA